MAKFHMRVKGSSRAMKPIGGSSSSNPKSTKHRASARAQRLASIYPLIAVDEHIDVNGKQNQQRNADTAQLLQHLPLNEMSLDEQRMKPIAGNKQRQSKSLEPEMKQESALIAQLASDNITLDEKRELLKREHKLWQLLPMHFSESSPDYQTMMPILAPILGAALNERPDLRLTALGSIRAALQMDTSHGFKEMEKFAKNFLPILFSLYTNEDGGENGGANGKVDPKAVRLSTLETIRLYMNHIPTPLLKQYINVALQKLTGPEAAKGEISERNLLLSDILIAMCISAGAEEIQAILTCLQSWFSGTGRMQKKAYRLLAQVYKRIEEPELKPFFDANRQFLQQTIQLSVDNVTKSAYQWRIDIYRNVIHSIGDFDSLREFCESIHSEVITCMDTANSTPTRHQAANCLMEMSIELLRLWTIEGMDSANPLDLLFANLFDFLKTKESDGTDNKLYHQCALIALNILAQKQLRHSNATLISHLIRHTSVALQTVDPKCRVLAIRLMRTVCAKIEHFMFEQYKDLILKGVFSQSTKDPTVRIRKSNALLLNLLLNRLGIDELMKSSQNNAVWAKMLKNLQKMRRRRERKHGAAGTDPMAPPTAGASGRQSRTGASSIISGTSTGALSTLISMGAKTANADSIFDILGDDSSDEEEGEHAGPKSAAFAIFIHFSRQCGSVVVTQTLQKRREVRIPVASMN